MFGKLSRLRPHGLNGPDALQPGTIRDWCALTHTQLSLDEIDVLLKADAAYLAAWHRETGKDGEG